jgi:hypothetical protein
VALASARPTLGFGIVRVTCQLKGSDLLIPAVGELTISASYIRVMRTELLPGRTFQPRETDAVIVNEAFGPGILCRGRQTSADRIGVAHHRRNRWQHSTGLPPTGRARAISLHVL